MSRLDRLIEQFGRHLGAPRPKVLSAAERVLLIVYEPPLERAVRGRASDFEAACGPARRWVAVDLTSALADFLNDQPAAEREDLFGYPEAAPQVFAADFPDYVGSRVQDAADRVGDGGVLAVTGVGSLFGACPLSAVLEKVEPPESGHLAVFLPGEDNPAGVRPLGGPPNWNYTATVITLSPAGRGDAG